MQFYVPSLRDPHAVTQLKETILTSEPDATIQIDLDQQRVTIDSKASEETFRQLITASGHRIQD